jgi:SP family arabinose:H+ symporter-like MFS transporter
LAAILILPCAPNLVSPEPMNSNTRHTVTIAFIVALGGFLMGFDASVISGVVKFIEIEFDLNKIQLGWAVASLALSATAAMMIAGPLSDRIGRKPVLRYAALLFLVSAVMSALAPNFLLLVIARMIGGLGVGAALIIAPMYIAEISPPKMRGRMVSINQLNIVIGISVAFFTNYLILQLGQSETSWALNLKLDEWNWRWMLGLEALPAVFYFIFLWLVPESPRWLIMKDRHSEAMAVMTKFHGSEQATIQIDEINSNIRQAQSIKASRFKDLFNKPMRLVLMIGLTVAVLQQITGINAVFFYAPMIFEQSGIGTDASYMQAILVGLTNLAFTLIAIALIDKIGRKTLLIIGVQGIAICMFVLAWGFGNATYTLNSESIDQLPDSVDRVKIASIANQTFNSDLEYKKALTRVLGADVMTQNESALISAAISMNPNVILLGILGFVASFAVSIGPVMWVLFSELFPNRIRGLAISFVGLVNSAVSFLVQLVFPWQLANVGNAGTFMIYGVFAVIGLLIIMKLLPETKGKSLEELEDMLVKQAPVN